MMIPLKLPELYEEKKEILIKIISHLNDNKMGYINVPTGWGKTFLSKHLIKEYLEKEKKIIFITSGNKQLLRQTYYLDEQKEIKLFPKSICLSSDFQINTWSENNIINFIQNNNSEVIFASLQTILSKKKEKLAEFFSKYFDLFIIDEVHNFIKNFNGLFYWLDLNNLSSFNIKIIEKNQENILKSAPKGDVKTKRIKQILKFSERFNLLKSLDNKGNYKLTKLGEKYKKSLDRNNPWRFRKKMRNILITSFLLRPFSSGVKLGIYNLLKLTSNTYENIPKRELYKLFAFLCGKIDSWVSEKTLKDIYYFYSNYSEELGLIKRTPKDFFILSVEGIKIFKIYDNYYKTYLEAKRYLLES